MDSTTHDSPRSLHHSQYGHGHSGLAATGFTHQAKDFPLADVEAHFVRRYHRSTVSQVVHRKVLYVENPGVLIVTRPHAWTPRSLGLAISSSPTVIRKKPVKMIISMRIGGSHHQTIPRRRADA